MDERVNGMNSPLAANIAREFDSIPLLEIS